MNRHAFPNSSARNPEGFTLLELLVAMALAGAVLAALYGSFFLTQRAMARVDDALLRLQESRACMDVLKRELESAFFSSDRAYCRFQLEDRDVFGQSTARLDMTTYIPLLKGLMRVTYSVEEKSGGLVLVKSLQSAYDRGGAASQLQIDLLEGVRSFSVEVRQGDRWLRTWKSDPSHGIPDEIRLQISFRRGPEQSDSRDDSAFTLTETVYPKFNRRLS